MIFIKKLLPLLIICILLSSCSKNYIVYCKPPNSGPFIVKNYHYGMNLEYIHINSLDVDSVRLKGDTTYTEYKYR